MFSCLTCSKLTTYAQIFCPSCATEWQRAHLPRLEAEKLEGIDLYAALRYEGAAARLVRVAKGQPFGRLSPALRDAFMDLVEHWCPLFKDLQPDAVVALPSNPVRVYFQTDLAQQLAEQIAYVIQRPCWPSLLIRNFDNPFVGPQAQKSLPNQERRASRFMHSLLAREVMRFGALRSRHLLLIDDVCATGATMRDAATLLSAHIPNLRLSAWVLARSFSQKAAKLQVDLMDAPTPPYR